MVVTIWRRVHCSGKTISKEKRAVECPTTCSYWSIQSGNGWCWSSRKGAAWLETFDQWYRVVLTFNYKLYEYWFCVMLVDLSGYGLQCYGLQCYKNQFRCHVESILIHIKCPRCLQKLIVPARSWPTSTFKVFTEICLDGFDYCPSTGTMGRYNVYKRSCCSTWGKCDQNMPANTCFQIFHE